MQVAVWDDGSTDETKGIMEGMSGSLDLRYGWHQHRGYRISLNRNRGARLLDSDTTHVWFVDSDVVLNLDAATHAKQLIEVYPNEVIVGKYIWLPPMVVAPADILKNWPALVKGQLPAVPVDYKDDIVMCDPRAESLWDCTIRRDTIRGIALGGNLIVPMAWLRRTGGFDEKIEGQGQDCEFGFNLQAAGARAVCCSHIVGYHLSHYRDRKWLSTSVKETITYIHKKWDQTVPREEIPK